MNRRESLKLNTWRELHQRSWRRFRRTHNE